MDRGIEVSKKLHFYKFCENQWLNRKGRSKLALQLRGSLSYFLDVLVQAEHLEPGAIQRKCYPLPGCRSWDRNCWYIKGQVCGAENVDKQQDTAIGEGVGGTGISVMGTSGHNASHLSICLQEASKTESLLLSPKCSLEVIKSSGPRRTKLGLWSGKFL